MKIVDIKIKKLRIKMKSPFKIAFAVQDYADNVIIKIVTDEGIYGLGEAAPFAPVTGETVDTVISTLNMFKEGLIGMDSLEIEKIHVLMDRLIAGNTAAKAAVDIALFDIMGKAMGQPLYKVLGGFSREVQNDVTIGIDTPENMANEAKERVEKDGFRILKIKAGINPDDDIKALKLIRETVGNDIRLRVDANQGYNVTEAVRVLKEFEKIGVEAVEQCLPDWNIDDSKLIRDKVNMSIMLDESIHSPKDAAKACKAGAADVLNIKLMKCGGLYNALKINAIAEANDVRCMVGCMVESKIAITAGASLVAAKQNITEADCDSLLFCVDPDNDMIGGLETDKDIFRLPDKPGLGIDFDF